MQLNLKGKVAKVVASRKSLGFGIAQELVREGVHVSMASCSQAEINSAAFQLRQETNAQVLATVFVDFPDQAWQAAFEMNLMSAARMIHGVIPSRQSRGVGSILTVTFSSVKEPIDVLILSNMMPPGATSLVKSLSLKLVPMKIRVNDMMLGQIDIDLVCTIDEAQARVAGISVEERKAQSKATIPLQRNDTIEYFGKMGAFLHSDAPSYITGSIAIDEVSLKKVC